MLILKIFKKAELQKLKFYSYVIPLWNEILILCFNLSTFKNRYKVRFFINSGRLYVFGKVNAFERKRNKNKWDDLFFEFNSWVL